MLWVQDVRSETLHLLGSPKPVLGMKVKQGESVIRLFLKIKLSTTISMKGLVESSPMIWLFI